MFLHGVAGVVGVGVEGFEGIFDDEFVSLGVSGGRFGEGAQLELKFAVSFDHELEGFADIPMLIMKHFNVVGDFVDEGGEVFQQIGRASCRERV